MAKTKNRYKSLSIVQSHKLYILFLLVCVILILFSILSELRKQEDILDVNTATLISDAYNDLRILQARNVELRNILRDLNNHELTINRDIHHTRFQKHILRLNNKTFMNSDSLLKPSTNYEVFRRRIFNNVQEFWYFVSSEVHQLIPKLPNTTVIDSVYKNIIDYGSQHKQSLLSDLTELSKVDGFNKWREVEINDLSNIVQERLHYLQNPANCEEAQKLVCNINNKCNFGCQMHSLVSCLILAYGTKRTLILNLENANFYNTKWEKIFQPLSESCNSTGSDSFVSWPGTNNDKVIAVSASMNLNPRSDYLPLAIPEDLSYRLTLVHGNPIVWWVGQILKYLLRLQESTAVYIKEKIKNLNISSPFVGVYLNELRVVGSGLQIQEHMLRVEDYFLQLDMKNDTKRRVYVVTDDLNAICLIKSQYSNYEVFYNSNNKSKQINIMDLLVDIHILSQSDFLVGNFSSDICRLAYELMQDNYVDASNKFASLDVIYFYDHQKYNKRKVIYSHKAERKEEIDLSLGDIIDIKSNYWNGYSWGTNLQTNASGLFPNFKVDIEQNVVSFPTYSELNSNTK